MKLLIRFLIGLCLGLIFGVTSVYAAGSILVSTVTTIGTGEYEFTYTCTADASGATIPSTATSFDVDGWVSEVITNPGTPAPTNGYNATLTDEDGIDIMGGQLAGRSSTLSELAKPKGDGVRCDRRVQGKLTLNITGNNVNSAVIVVKVRFYI